MNTANPNLQGVTTITSCTLVYNTTGALGPETTGTSNSIEIGNGTLQFNSAVGGNFSYSLADPIKFWGTGGISIVLLDYTTRTATLSGPITLDTDARFYGAPLYYNFGTAQIISSGVISESAAGKNVRIEGDVALSGTNTFTGKVYVGNGLSNNARVTVPVFNDDGTAGPLGAGSGLQLGNSAGDGYDGEVIYTGGTVSSNRTIQIEGNNGTVGVSSPSSKLTLTGFISGSGSGSSHNFEKSGPGSLVLKAANTFTGQTQLANGTLIVSNPGALGTSSSAIQVGTYSHTAASDNLSLLLENGITLSRPVYVNNYNTTGTTTLGLAGSGAGTFAGGITLTHNTVVKADTGGTINFTTGAVTGTGSVSITKTGAGTATFSGGITLPGGGITVVDGGELVLNNTASLVSPVSLARGVTVISGTLTLGTTTATNTLTIPNYYMRGAGASNLTWKLAALTSTDAAQFDNLQVNTGGIADSLEIETGATLTVDLSLLGVSSRPTVGNFSLNDPFWATVQTWDVVHFAGSGSNSLTAGALNPFTVANGVWAGGTFDSFVGGGAGAFAGFAAGDVFLRFTPTAVPEPSTYALLALGGTFLLLTRLRRRV